MTRRELAALSCKVIAVWLFAQALLYGGGFAVTALALTFAAVRREFDSGNLLTLGLTVLPAIGYALVGWLLWAKSDAVASRMVSDDPNPVTLSSASASDLLSIAISIAGVFVLLDAVHAIVRTFALVARSGESITHLSDDVGWMSNLIAHVAQGAIGVWLVFGSRGIAGVIRKLRNPSYGRPDEPTA